MQPFRPLKTENTSDLLCAERAADDLCDATDTRGNLIAAECQQLCRIKAAEGLAIHKRLLHLHVRVFARARACVYTTSLCMYGSTHGARAHGRMQYHRAS